MKQGSFLINTSRGGLVDETALIQAIESGGIAGAGLDVFDPEPPKPDNPLLRLPSVVLTPHIAAGTRDAFLEKMTFVFDNLERFWHGGTVENLIQLGSPHRAA
jgi:phosphoglycerate dehydrogenase-like enzyme